MTRAVALGGTAFGELEVNTEWLPLAVGEVAELASHAESRVPVDECLHAALPHVRMGPAETDEAEGLWPLYGTGTKGMGGRGRHPLVWVMVGRGRVGVIRRADVTCPLTPCLTRTAGGGILGSGGGKQGYGLVIGLGAVAQVGMMRGKGGRGSGREGMNPTVERCGFNGTAQLAAQVPGACGSSKKRFEGRGRGRGTVLARCLGWVFGKLTA
jgi:hypothetical protein